MNGSHRASSPPMVTSDMDYLLEDTTGNVTDTDFCDINDRRFLRVRKTLERSDLVAVQVFDLGSIHPDFHSDYHKLSCAVMVLPNASATDCQATVQYHNWEASIPVDRYLRKPLLSRSSSRTFNMSDGQEYKWSHSSSPGCEWTSTTTQGYLVAHYDLKPSSEPEYKGSSGNTLTICRSFTHLTVEIVTSLILMRHAQGT